MKKFLIVFVYVFVYVFVFTFINNFADAGSIVRVYKHHLNYAMFVNYQECFRDLKNNKTNAYCLYPIHNMTIEPGKAYAEIKLPDYLDYALIVNAYEHDQEKQIATGEFLHDEACRAFSNLPITLDSQDGNIICRC